MGRRKASTSYAEWRLRESLLEQSFYEQKYKRLLTSMFEWDNLPDGISYRFIEKYLYSHGCVVFFKNSMGFFQVARATIMHRNCYEEPVAFKTYDITGHQEIVKACDCVAIYNNAFMEGEALNVQFFAKRLSNIEKTIDCNLQQLKHPTIVACPESQVETVRAFYAKMQNGEPFIPVDSSFFEENRWEVWDMKAQNHVRELQEVKHDYENEGLTFFGINNVNILKRERLITGEANQNNEQIELMKNTRYRARFEAVQQINEKWGLDIKVRLSTEYLEEVEGGSENE